MELAMKELDWNKRVRQMAKELRPLERRRNELMKMSKYKTLDKKDDAELEALFDEIADKCNQDFEELLSLSGIQ